MGVASLVLGIIAFLTGWIGVLPLFWWVGLIVVIIAILAIIFAGIGMAQAKKAGRTDGIAIAGLVLGILGLLGAVICCIIGAIATAVLASGWQMINGQEITNQITDNIQKALENLPVPTY